MPNKLDEECMSLEARWSNKQYKQFKPLEKKFILNHRQIELTINKAREEKYRQLCSVNAPLTAIITINPKRYKNVKTQITDGYDIMKRRSSKYGQNITDRAITI